MLGPCRRRSRRSGLKLPTRFASIKYLAARAGPRWASRNSIYGDNVPHLISARSVWVSAALSHILSCWESYNFREGTSMRRRSTLGLAFLLAVSTIVITAGPAFAAGDITGTVTSELGQAIPGICVEAHDSTAGRPMRGTRSSGSTAPPPTAPTPLPQSLTGTTNSSSTTRPSPLCGHHVEPATPEVTAEWHNNVADFADATVVSIAGGDQVVDAVLTGTAPS